MDASVYESTVSLLKNMLEKDILIVKEFINRLSSKPQIKDETYNPYKPLTREEIIEQLAIARQHADEGKTMDAHKASSNIREKYGL